MESDDDPKRAACVLVRHEDKVLAIRRSDTGKYCLPGGSCKVGESYQDAAVRELREEAHFDLHEPVQIYEAASDTPGMQTAVFTGWCSEWPVSDNPKYPARPKGSDEGATEWVHPSVLMSNETGAFPAFAWALFMMLDTTHLAKALDLGVADVHIDSAGQAPAKRKPMAQNPFPPKKGKPDPKAAPAAKGKNLFGKKPKKGAVPKKGSFGEKTKVKRVGMRSGFRLSINDPKRGRIEVRHMTDVQAPGVELSEVELSDTARPVWIQIAKPGKYFKDGFFTLDEQVFSDIIKNFNASENRQVPIDFEHATEMPAHAGSIPALGAPAQGWIKSIEMRQDGNLYGLVEWGELARDYIKSGQYKYISPAVRFGARDRHSGKDIGAKLTSAALTNKPFLDGMRAVAASDEATHIEELVASADVPDVILSAYSTSEYMPQIRACLKLGDMATPQECSDALGRVREHLMAAGGDHNAMPQGVPLGDYLKPMRAMVGAGFGSSWDDIFETVEDLINAAIKEHEAKYHADQVDAADADVEDEESERRDDEEEDDEDENINAMDSGTNEEEQAMNEEFIKQLTDSKAQVTTLADQVKTLTASTEKSAADVAGLTLKLKDSESKTAEATAKIADLEKSNKELTEKLAAEETKRMDDKVGVAFATYKDTKKLTDANRKQMMITLKSDPALFDELYPAVDPSKQHLLRDVVSRDPVKTVETPRTATVTAVPTMNETITKLMKEDPKLALEDAVSRAFTEVSTKAGLNPDTL